MNELRARTAGNPFDTDVRDTQRLKGLSSPEERAAVAADIHTLRRDGYLILEELLTTDKVAEIGAAMDTIHAATPLGITDFEGFRTKRIYNFMKNLPNGPLVKLVAILAALCWATLVQAQSSSPGHGVIESPHIQVSGIGFISGWKCETAGPLTVRFDGGKAIPLVYGSERADTRSVCGDSRNGFIAIMNWGRLADGTHTAVAYDNGVEFDRASFTVAGTGVEFLREVTGSGTASLSNGQDVTLVWSEVAQAFVATAFTGGAVAPFNPPVPYPEMIVVDGAYAGDQELVQYKGMLELPPPTYQEALVRGDTVTWYSSFSFSMIFEPDAWLATEERGESERLIPKEDLPKRLGDVEKIYTSTPLLHETGHVFIFNLTGVGGGITIYNGEHLPAYGVRVNRPDLAYEGGQNIVYFINKDTAEIGFKLVPSNLDEAGDGWLSEGLPYRGCRKGDDEETKRLCRESIKKRDAWVAKVWFPNQGRGPWRQVSSFHVAIMPGHIFQDMQSWVSVEDLEADPQISWPHSSFITDLAGTGKLEIVLATPSQYNAWRERDDLSIFLAPKLELGSVVD